ncbi:MAG: 3-isopropylmalate dehydratase small subunit [Alicyclobacillus sp.]|nr:3-isopropylmalate dehydratase small subunit [Alicyclobacillus sp.]
MEPLIRLNGVVAALNRVNVDTDQIIPKQFLKRIERSGFGQFLFYDWRFLSDGSENPEFELNQPRYAGATILLAGANFGCGSSREHAPWALLDYGFRVIIAPSFADIFYNNCYKNGMLPIVLPEDVVADLFRRVSAHNGYRLTVDLEAQTITDDSGLSISFEVDPYRRSLLLQGLDDIGVTLQLSDKISAYEQTRRPYQLIAQA